MRALFSVFPSLAVGLALLGGCSYRQITEPPVYSDQPLHSLCDHGRSLTVSNRGLFDARANVGDLLLAGQLSTQPLENLLAYRAVRLDYLPDSGLNVTLISRRDGELTELLPAAWIDCADDAMEIELPSDTFYAWASVGVNARRLRLQVTPDDTLILHLLWEEKGMMMMVLPMRFTGDGWASFQADDTAQYDPLPAPADIALLGACQDLTGTYAVDGESVRLDGSLDHRTAEAQFFRPEIIGDRAPPAEGWVAADLELSHPPDGGIVLALVRDDGTRLDRSIDAARVSCKEGRWFIEGEKEVLSPWMLLTGSGGVMREDLVLWRDAEGALMVRGTYRSRGAIFLVPVGHTSEIFIRYEQPARRRFPPGAIR